METNEALNEQLKLARTLIDRKQQLLDEARADGARVCLGALAGWICAFAFGLAWLAGC